MKKLRKFIFWGLAIVGGVALLFLALRPQPVEVDLATISVQPMQVTVDEDGETRIREPYLISAPLAGRLMRVELEPGDSISETDVLAVIDPGEPGLLDARTLAESEARVSASQANSHRAASQLDVARAEVEKWERYLERDIQRLENGAISPPMLEDTKHALRIAQSNFCGAESGLEVAEFELEQAKAALIFSKARGAESSATDRHFRINSPIEGVVLRRFQESSTVLPAGERILEIGDPNDLEIRIDVLSQDAVKIRAGQRIIIEHWGGDKDLLAHVRRVEPSAFTKVSALGVDEQRVWVYADFAETVQGPADQPHSKSLGDAYRVEARIIVWEKEDATTVPAAALFRDGESWAVYIVSESGKATLKHITIGQHNGNEAELLEGIPVGAEVVLHPGDRVMEGTPVAERAQ